MIKTNNTTNLKNISKYLLTTTLTLGLLSATNTVIANQNSTIDNYNTRYVFQNLIVDGLLFCVGIVNKEIGTKPYSQV
jgi:hypothetical protein